MFSPLVLGGCRWSSPEWVEDLSSAPLVKISEEKVVVVAWGSKHFRKNLDCVDRFNVGVEHNGVERKLCARERKEG